MGESYSAPVSETYSTPPTHQFTGKERDTESGNDYFDARYYSSAMGRFLSPDWSAKEDPVPYAQMDDPQSLNLYSYVRNNPLTRIDADGHDWDDALDAGAGFVRGVASSLSFGLVGAPSANDSAASLSGQLAGSLAVTHLSATTLAASGPTALGGLVAAPETGGASLVAEPVAGAAALISSGTLAGGTKNVAAVADAMGNGSYTNTHASGKTYDGKGDEARAKASGARVEKETGDKQVSTEHTTSADSRESFKDESRRLDSHGGAGSDQNHNKIESPGKKYRQQDGSN